MGRDFLAGGRGDELCGDGGEERAARAEVDVLRAGVEG